MKFLPVDLTNAKKRPQLAAVDDDVFEWAQNLPWHTNRLGRPFRRSGGKVVWLDEQIAGKLGITAEVPLGRLNGDGLDCRRENLTARDPQPLATREGGEVFALPGHRVARAELYKHLDRYVGALHTARPARLTSAQVRRLLEEVRRGYLKGASLVTIQQWIGEEFDHVLSVGQISQILRGRSLRIPAYNYNALQKTRK